MCSVVHPLATVPDGTILKRRDVSITVDTSEDSTQSCGQSPIEIQFTDAGFKVRPMPEGEDVTALLHRVKQGDRVAEARLLEVLYAELRRIAGICIRSEPQEMTLQPTALVHEAYLRLAGNQAGDWQDRRHFLAAAAQVMRHVLVDCARTRRAQKRGGDLCRVELYADVPAPQDWALDLLDLDEALGRLAKLDERQARIVEMRFFVGLTVLEIAGILGLSERTIKREWEFARAWLHGQLTRKRNKPIDTEAASKG